MLLRERITLTAESGQTMAEYAFVLSVIILGVIAAFTLFSDAVAASINDAVDMIKSVS
jgi:Flp pilus assembly pilin Flp